MPVNTAALKTFAPAMRRQLLEAVGRKLDLLLHSQTPDTLSTYAKQIVELREQEAENREQLLERVAYTWFNRLCALRYLDARGWHPFGCKVLMPAAEGETQPELLKLMRAGSLPAELKPHTNEARLHGLLDGQIPPAIAGADQQAEVYRELVLASCRSYHQLLPALFEGLDDASELLLPDDLLSEGSIAGAFRSSISDEDCEDVEIIGWLYQFYITEKKDALMGNKKAVHLSDTPFVTQIFTPEWIAKFLVSNSISRLCREVAPRDGSRRTAIPFLDEGFESSLNEGRPCSPEDIRILDPACGSGHLLAKAFDAMYEIYMLLGYQEKEVPGLILEKNLHGLDVCPRAVQLSRLTLWLKSREKQRNLRMLKDISNIGCLDPHIVHRSANTLAAKAGRLGGGYIEVVSFFQDVAKQYALGSLLVLRGQPDSIKKATSFFSATKSGDSAAGLFETEELVSRQEIEFINTLSILASSYDFVICNPPYLNLRRMPGNLKEQLSPIYDDYRWDLFGCFFSRSQKFLKEGGYASFMTPNVWMHRSSHEAMRYDLSRSYQLCTLLELSTSGFDGAAVQICAFTYRKRSIERAASIIDLRACGSSEITEAYAEEVLSNQQHEGRRYVETQLLASIPGGLFSYWLTKEEINCFQKFPPIGSMLVFKQGMATSNNARFLRCWHEVDFSRIDFSCTSPTELAASTKRWFPYNKGGAPLKWYGNNEYIVNWESDGKEMKEFTSTLPQGTWVRLKSREYYCLPSMTYSAISMGAFACRLNGPGFLFDTNGTSVFTTSPKLDLLEAASLLNSRSAEVFLSSLCATLDNTMEGVRQVPLPTPPKAVRSLASKSIEVAKKDWDCHERSWDFSRLDGLEDAFSLSESCDNYCSSLIQRKEMLDELQRQSDELWLCAYGLSASTGFGAVSEEREICVTACEYVTRYLSYFLGCAVGRYSLDQSGLILADSSDSQTEQLAAYEAKVGKPLSAVQFKPDPDGIIPVLDGEWFEDDIVARTRQFLAITFPESSVAENLRFIEKSLGKDIRKYFCTEFYKDHLLTYKKRPIYWMVQSPKKGFACLIYLHRYTKDTLNQVLNNYFRPYLQKLEARLAQLGLDQLNDDLPTRERTAARKEAEKITKVLKECQAWEQDALLPLAQQRIELDLDDGVKVNYLKLQDVLATIPGLAAKED